MTWESTPILNGEQPEAVEDSEVALNDPGCVTTAHPTTALSYWDLGLLNLRGLFCTHLIASSERDIPVIGLSELIKTRTRVKTNCLKLVIFRNDPLSIHRRTASKGLRKTVTLFNNLMHN